MNKKNIVMFVINPLYPDHIIGGAAKHAQKIALHLGELGHQITVLCTHNNNSTFQWHENVTVHPTLHFKQPFPEPYAIPAYQTANIFHEVASYLETADCFYMHDGEYLFPFAYQHVPTVVSLRDNVYAETMLGGFLFQGDALIAISDYSHDFYLNTMGRFFPEFKERLVVIKNGLDWNRFKPSPASEEIRQLIPLDPQKYALVLHPHRPESSKGLPQTIAVADLLVHQHGITNLRVLIPRWVESGVSTAVREFYQEMRQQIHQRGLEEHVYFHDWIPQRLMQEYYSMGRVMLSLGHFPESFGNTVYESLGCGTPSIATRISTHRELLPDHLLDKVHFGDNETATRLAADIIKSGRRVSAETIAYLHEYYSTERQLNMYADTILNAKPLGIMAYQHQPITAQTRWQLASWCYQWEEGIYHDFIAEHRAMRPLQTLLRDYPQGFTWAEAALQGVPQQMVTAWYKDGYVIPR